LYPLGDSKTGKEQNQNDLINCPKCNTKMIRMVDAQQSHIWFEHCVTCSGNYFDAGEFKDLQEDTIFDFVKTCILLVIQKPEKNKTKTT
jgi:Zn-finger nucleic acid-binding protein